MNSEASGPASSYQGLSAKFNDLDIRNKLLLAVSVPLSLMVIIAVVVYIQVAEQSRTQERTLHTHRVLEGVGRIATLIVDMETGERGFLITGKDEFLEPFVNAQAEWDTKISSLISLVADNPAQARRLDKLDSLEKRWLREAANSEISLRRKVPKPDVSMHYIQSVLRAGTGKQLLNKMRELLTKMRKLPDSGGDYLELKILDALAKNIVDQETGERGFLITGDESFLQPYHDGKEQFIGNLARLRRASQPNYAKEQVLSILHDIRTDSTRWGSDFASKDIELRKTSSAATVLEKMKSDVLAGTRPNFQRNMSRALAQLLRVFQKAGQNKHENMVLQLRQTLAEAYNGFAGFLLQDTDQQLQLYLDVNAEFEQQLARLEQGIFNLPEQVIFDQQIDELERLHRSWLSQAAEPEIGARRELVELSTNSVEYLQAVLGRGLKNSLLGKLRGQSQALEALFLDQSDIRGAYLVARLKTAVGDQETGYQRFLITGEQYFLEPYSNGLLELNSLFVELNVHIASTYDDQSQIAARTKRALVELQGTAGQWRMDTAEPEIRKRRGFIREDNDTLKTIQKILVRSTGKTILDLLREEFSTLTNTFTTSGNKRALGLLLQLEKSIVDQESGQRGFLITGDDSFLEPYYAGRETFNDLVSITYNLIAVQIDPLQVDRRLANIKRLYAEWQNQVKVIVSRDTPDKQDPAEDPLPTQLAAGLGKTSMESLNFALDELNRLVYLTADQNSHGALQEVSRALTQQQTWLKVYQIERDDSVWEAYHQAGHAVTVALAGFETDIFRSIDREAAFASLELVRTLTQRWQEEAADPEITIRREMDARLSSMNDITLMIESGTGKAIIDEMRVLIARISAEENQLLDARGIESTGAAKDTVVATIVATILAMVLALAAMIVVSSRLTRRLSALDCAVEQVAGGDYDVELTDQARDEIGRLSAGFERMTRELVSSRDSMVKASNVKSEFLANMSHEIRTPMNGVIGIVELLKNTDLTEHQRRLIGTMESCGDGLLTVVNDVLDYSKIEAGEMSYDEQPFLLSKVLQDSIFLFDGEASRKNLVLSLEMDSSVDGMYLGDASRIRQILINFLSNGVKFTESGSVTVLCWALLLKDDRTEVTFSVRDSGIGISEANIERIFESFSQADMSTTRLYGGTGLGLSISLKMCEAMGGRLWVDSTEGQGSTFSFCLPLSRTVETHKRNPIRQEENFSELASSLPLSILLVEDNVTNSDILLQLLESLGYTADLAVNGKLALSALENKTYDIVLMDMQMPVMGGMEATEKIIARWGAERPKIVALTANVLPSDQAAYTAAGMDYFLPKPVTQASLVEALLACVRDADHSFDSDKASATECRAKEKVGAVTPAAAHDDGRTCILLIDDDELEHEFAREALTEDRWQFVSAMSGEEGLQLLAKLNPSVILVDNRMPGLEGLAVIEKIRAMERFKNTPLYLCTGADPTRDMKDKLAQYSADYFPKLMLSGAAFPKKLDEILSDR